MCTSRTCRMPVQNDAADAACGYRIRPQFKARLGPALREPAATHQEAVRASYFRKFRPRSREQTNLKHLNDDFQLFLQRIGKHFGFFLLVDCSMSKEPGRGMTLISNSFGTIQHALIQGHATLTSTKTHLLASKGDT